MSPITHCFTQYPKDTAPPICISSLFNKQHVKQCPRCNVYQSSSSPPKRPPPLMSTSSSSSSSSFSSSFFSSAAGAAAAAAAGAAAPTPTAHTQPQLHTRSSEHIENVLATQVRSEHHRPVRSNGVAGGLDQLVEVFLLSVTQRREANSHFDLRVGTNQDGKRNDELFLFSGRHVFKRRHGC